MILTILRQFHYKGKGVFMKTLEVRHVTKCFGQNTVLEDINMTFHEGKVHVLMGENGAGKSTLLKIIAGYHPPDTGDIILDGARLELHSPMDSKKHRISMVYQELTLQPEMTVFDNLFLGTEQVNRANMIKTRSQQERLHSISARYGIQVNEKSLVKNLSLSEQCMAEVLKALITEPDVILFDEATSALDSENVRHLFGIINQLKQEKKIIIFISHRMEEIFEIGDRVTVLKDGQAVLSAPAAELNQDTLVESMVGRSIKEVFPPKCREQGRAVLEVRHLSSKEGRLKDISLCVHEGEIVGIAGLKGHGQGELLSCLAGITRIDSGELILDDHSRRYRTPRDAVRDGVILVPEDRKTQALFLNHSILRNLGVSSLFLRQKAGILSQSAEEAFVSEALQDMSVKCSSDSEPVNCLSGGNQQKVVLGRILGIKPRVILFQEPTRGIDVQTKQDIYRKIRTLAQSGVCILLYSSDLIEVVGISDTVYTMYEGQITRKLTGDDINEVAIMRGAVGLQGGTRPC